jgi:hypothetical protein
MTVDNIDPERFDPATDRQRGLDIGRTDPTRDRQPLDAEREVGFGGNQPPAGQLVGGIGHDKADVVAASRLLRREVENVSEQPADRGSEDMEDTHGARLPQ